MSFECYKITVLVCFEVKRIFRVNASHSEAPIIVKRLLLNMLILKREMLMPFGNIIGCLLQGDWQNPTINIEVVVSFANYMLSNHHGDYLLH